MKPSHDRLLSSLLLGLIGTLDSAQAGAQAPAPAHAPQTYTRIAQSGAYEQMAVSLYRDGPREMIEMSRAADAAHPKGWRSRTWFDFQAHRQYAIDSNAPGQCSVIRYASDGPPPLLDPVGNAAGMAAQIPAGAKPIGKETLGGIETRIFEPGPGAKIWVDANHHLALKAQITMDGATTPKTMLDLTGIQFTAPDPALLVPPDNCRLIAGEANANGGHAEIGGGK